MRFSIYASLLIFFGSCTTSISQKKATYLSEEFNSYWYGGLAEITSYQLEQSRYGKIHSGQAVLIFVTEPFSKSKHVKLDHWKEQNEDQLSVLKLNMSKKFLTGIYPYSMMMSTFSPVHFEQDLFPLKVTVTNQEWCGHTFLQLNKSNDYYRLRGFSYFETEGDQDLELPLTYLEDGIWSHIRLQPTTLPQGKISIIPGSFHLRLNHRQAAPLTATATLELVEKSFFNDKTPHHKYAIIYENRSLHIYFEKNFPNAILGWEETYNGVSTVAKKIHSIQTAYWNQNDPSDKILRKDLGLPHE